MNEILSWKNGKLIPSKDLGMSTWDAHYFFGWAVFDAFRTYNHKLHNIDYHLNRLYKSATLTNIPINYSKDELKEIIKSLMENNKMLFNNDEYRFMVFASPGKFKIFDDYGDTEPNLSIQLTNMSRYSKFIYPNLDKGWASLITHQKQIPSRYFDVRIKSCSRLHYGMADAECKILSEPTNPILLDEHGNLCESSGANIAFVKDGIVYIPNGTDMLYGATIGDLKMVLDNLSIKYVEGIYKPYDLLDADTILYTSTYSGITPSYKLIYNGITHHLKHSNIYNKILNGYSDLVGLNIKEQWKRWYEKESI